ncbi:hypothetical protein QJS10_CPA16g00959 [Acorus calamus]|uniref:Uncharacterized protein n=1 Tax=Acorus calamus TaxID=4465 RepID=A0AAV9CZT8_ACOCL|nr:hypothetical protein QJS10_CPA16g00959 [Acorus calamus]
MGPFPIDQPRNSLDQRASVCMDQGPVEPHSTAKKKLCVLASGPHQIVDRANPTFDILTTP